MRELNDTCYHALLGLAVGDCFGAPFEYHKDAPELALFSMSEKRYLDSWDDVGQRKVKWCRKPGLHTDDTQQALLLVLAWLKRETPEDAATFFVNTCRAMASVELKGAQFGVHRGTGGNFRTAISTGRPVDTAGLGAPMRVGPVATLFDDPQDMVEWILTVSKTTTSNPISLACAVKFAAVAWVLAHPGRRGEIRDVEWPDEIPSEVWNATTAALRVMKAEGEDALLEFGTMTGWANKRMSNAANGFALTGFPWAVSQALTAPTFSDAMVNVCSSGGDTDTVAAMAGCLAAIKHGEGAIPTWMTSNLRAFGSVFEPDVWDPIRDERAYTLEDIEYRKTCASKAAKLRKSKKESREVLDLFALAEEAFAEEAAAAADPEEPVLFYGHRKYHGEFSNFHAADFVLDGETWPTVEHYYMAQKNPDDEEFQKAIRAAETPHKAKKLGRAVVLREGWDDIKYDIMFKAVRAKFEQNEGLRAKLLDTDDRPLHENCADPWWGGGPNFPNGRDWLGAILMDVRDLLRGGG
jgi:ribA/ribD-fused uncharacterized protein